MSELTVFQNSSTAFSYAISNSITQALFTYLIGILTVYIAYQQFNANRYKIKMDLYERRLRVYNMTRDILHCALSANKVNNEQFREFEHCIAESNFIFKPDIHKHLSTLKKKLQAMQDNENSQDDKNQINGKSKMLSDKEAFILNEISSLSIIFSRYLSLRKL